MKKQKVRSLSLSRETLRSLSHADQLAMAGGAKALSINVCTQVVSDCLYCTTPVDGCRGDTTPATGCAIGVV